MNTIHNREPRFTRDDPRRAWAFRVEQGHTPAIRLEEDADGATLMYLYDPIDDWFGVSASMFREALNGVTGDVELHINCPGGDAFDGIAILNMLRQHDGDVTAVVDGIAASAASFIASGVDELVMAQNAELMIHDAWGICIGPAAEMDKMGDLLDQLSDNIAGIYADKADGSDEAWRDLMRAETWYVDSEAVDAGLADRVLESSEPANRKVPAVAARARSRKRSGPPTPDKYELHAVPTNVAAAG